MNDSILTELASKGYWPAAAAEYFNAKKYSKAVELCTTRLKEFPGVLSGRTVLARSLFYSGQYEAAEEQFHKILGLDPYNVVALKYLGDLKFIAGDEPTAFSYYDRVMEIEPCEGVLVWSLEKRTEEKTKVLTLKKKEEKIDTAGGYLKELPFKTETVADLLYSQGHPRLAVQVLRELYAETGDDRLREKLEKTEESIKGKER